MEAEGVMSFAIGFSFTMEIVNSCLDHSSNATMLAAVSAGLSAEQKLVPNSLIEHPFWCGKRKGSPQPNTGFGFGFVSLTHAASLGNPGVKDCLAARGFAVVCPSSGAASDPRLPFGPFPTCRMLWASNGRFTQ